MSDSVFVGKWAYRSFLNDPDLTVDPDKLLFGSGTLEFTKAPPLAVAGTIGDTDWGPLYLHGSENYGYPSQVRFQGKGLVNGEEWIYDYIGWLVPVWPNSTDTLQTAAIVGSVTRTIPHSNSSGGTNPAGVVASFYAVRIP